MNLVQQNEIQTPYLDPMSRAALVTTANAVVMGVAEATVSLTYKKQTETKPRIAGEDYVSMPGVSQEAQTGTLVVCRRVDNAENRRKHVVGKVYFRVKTMTRADGVEPYGYTNIRPEGITAFALLGVKPVQPAGQSKPKQGV